MNLENPYQAPATARSSSVTNSTARAVGLAFLAYCAAMLAINLPAVLLLDPEAPAHRYIPLAYVLPGFVAGWIAERRSGSRWPVASVWVVAIVSATYSFTGLVMLNGMREFMLVAGALTVQALLTIGAGWLGAGRR